MLDERVLLHLMANSRRRWNIGPRRWLYVRVFKGKPMLKSIDTSMLSAVHVDQVGIVRSCLSRFRDLLPRFTLKAGT